jgi:deazaflavin-dependent oxidoreductase (nitroreductase family)
MKWNAARMAVKPPPASSPFWKGFEYLTRVNTFLFRRSGGRIGSRIPFVGSPIILVHHVGARSGTHRVSPLIGLADGDRWVIVASKGGTDRHPSWFHNLKANPETEIEVGRDRIPVRARVVDEAERARLWPKLVETYPPYEEYQQFAGERRIPVISLDRR